MRRAGSAVLLLLLAGLILGTARAQEQSELEVPFVPTPETVVHEMLRLAHLTSSDVLYDLGSGDGRIVITAARKYGVHGVGIDLNPDRIAEARENARKAGVADKVTFRQEDLFKTDISKATVVTLYLLPSVNLRLRPKLLRELRPGTRVLSHDFDMGDWKPDRDVRVNEHKVYYWLIPNHR